MRPNYNAISRHAPEPHGTISLIEFARRPGEILVDQCSTSSPTVACLSLRTQIAHEGERWIGCDRVGATAVDHGPDALILGRQARPAPHTRHRRAGAAFNDAPSPPRGPDIRASILRLCQRTFAFSERLHHPGGNRRRALSASLVRQGGPASTPRRLHQAPMRILTGRHRLAARACTAAASRRARPVAGRGEARRRPTPPMSQVGKHSSAQFRASGGQNEVGKSRYPLSRAPDACQQATWRHIVSRPLTLSVRNLSHRRHGSRLRRERECPSDRTIRSRPPRNFGRASRSSLRPRGGPYRWYGPAAGRCGP